ncbi:hypothetical protein O181_009061 [Austropuccinia psidii MF-1]|uniref:Retrovirus-related Pol polyprotein from transposon TNT 1-94-like beta-barrel domain-containing protein n=1 Tax=Austropuccinia psidii MF-1 TaxID=1389203 RepID=A0A9Q3GJ45_9BASI|nr:hypothetical protein [Austropuccinia psidii MF-1]
MSALLTSNIEYSKKTKSLVVNCGATNHMFKNKELFSSFVETKSLNISTSDPTSNLITTGQGTVSIITKDTAFTLCNCLYVPNLSTNLVSLLQMFKNSITIHKEDKKLRIIKNNNLILSGKISNRLMISDFTKHATLLTNINTQPCWNTRLGHPSTQTLKSIDLSIFKKDHCNVYVKGKMMLKPFCRHFENVDKLLDFLHLDLLGPILPPLVSGDCYFLMIVDQHTSFNFTKVL